MWLSQGGKIDGKFSEVIDCKNHSNFVSMQVKEGLQDEDESDKNFVMSFSHCSMKDGKTFEDYMAAQDAWNAYQDENGFSDSAWVMFPIFGETDDSYDFKAIGTNDDQSSFCNDYRLMSEGHRRKSSELFDGVIDCDIPRLYNAITVRTMTAGEDNQVLQPLLNKKGRQ
ncbi:MAG: hypothetical protein OEM51_04275 [Gammaproteobacteria bacterium]|nr:hypothetical protein [Gammaproteobacteria bacterium]